MAPAPSSYDFMEKAALGQLQELARWGREKTFTQYPDGSRHTPPTVLRGLDPQGRDHALAESVLLPGETGSFPEDPHRQPP